MSDENIIDLTKSKSVDAFSTFGPSDVVLLAVTGGVGYLAKEAYKYFFPGTPSVVEQLRVLTELVETCGRVGATSLKVRISTNAHVAFAMPKSIKDSKIMNENNGTVDLEVVFK